VYSVRELFKNDTALAAGLLTAITGFLTGPILHMDPAAVGSIVGMLGLLLTIWVRSQVYSQKGAAKAATTAATEAVKAVSAVVAGPPGTVTTEGAQAIQDAVQDAVPGAAAPEVTPTAA
jgi:hypothetical protein